MVAPCDEQVNEMHRSENNGNVSQKNTSDNTYLWRALKSIQRTKERIFTNFDIGYLVVVDPSWSPPV